MKKSYLTAGLIALGVAAWIFSGHLTRPDDASDSASAAPAPATPPLVNVRVRTLNAVPHSSDVVLRGRTQALRTVDLKAQTDGRIVALPVEKGAGVNAGDLICRLAVDDRQARLAQAEALARQRQIEYAAAVQLAAKGYRAENQVSAAKALLDGAKAQVKEMKVELANTRIVAPFGGTLDKRPVEIGAYLQKGQSCATIVDEDPLLVVGEVSERHVSDIQIGDVSQVKLLDGHRLTGKIRFIAKTADPLTRTFRVELEIPNPDHSLRDGLTAEIRIAAREILTHRISPALLVLDAKGRMGVRIVDDQGIVRFRPVDIVGDDSQGMWVTGLPSRVTIITVGQEFVRAGQKVRSQADSGATT